MISNHFIRRTSGRPRTVKLTGREAPKRHHARAYTFPVIGNPFPCYRELLSLLWRIFFPVILRWLVPRKPQKAQQNRALRGFWPTLIPP